jgi:hypothetical protein
MPTVVVAETIAPNVTETIAGIVAPLTTPVEGGMKLNPYFDWSPFLGLPIWLFICIFFILVLITVFLYWLFRMKKLSAVRGYVDAMKKATQEDMQVWIIGKTRKLTIECLKYMDGMLSYYDKLKITKWHHNTRFSVIQIGGQPAMLVSDDWDQTRDVLSEIALTYTIEQFNNNQEELQKEEILKGDGKVVQPIMNFTDYRDFGRDVLELLFPDGLWIPAYNVFSPVKFQKIMPKGCSAGFGGGEFERDSRKLKKKTKPPTFWEQVLPFGLICGISLAFLLAGWMAPVGK